MSYSHMINLLAQVTLISPHGEYSISAKPFNPNTDSKVHGANMGPTWVLSVRDGPHVGPMNLAIREVSDKDNIIQ